MASKENQEALDSLFFKICKGNCNYCEKKCESYKEYIKIQKAIDDLELYKKAFEIATDDVKFFTNEIRKIYLEQARKELEKGRN